MGYVTITQIYKQGGINGTAGTPNFLQSIDSACVRVEATSIQQGGLQGALFELVKTDEDTTNLVGGNWIYFAAGGGSLTAAAPANSSSLTVTGLGESPISSNLAPTSDSLSGWDQGTSANSSFSTGGPQGANDWEYTGTGAAAGFQFTKSPVINVIPGTQYEFSSWVDPSQITSGVCYLGIFDINVSALYQETNIGAGPASRFSGAPWVCPQGVTQVRLVWDVNNCTVANGQKLKFSQPMLRTDGVSTPYIASDPAQSDIIAGDYVLISDGTNTDLMKVSSLSGGGAQVTLNLAAAPGQNTATTLNGYAANVTTVARLQYSGYLLGRERTTQYSKKYVIKSQGFVTRYNNVLCNADIVKQDCANSIYKLVNGYAATLPEVIINSANFAPANSILGTAQAKDGQVMKVIADLLKTENSQKSNVNYSFWVDAARQAHHGTLPGANIATPSGNLGDPGTGTRATPTFTIDLATGSTYGDLIGPLETSDMDMSQMINTAKIIGGKASNSKQPLEVIVQDKTSQGAWGYWEGVFSNPDLTDQTTAAQWGAGRLNISAYPRTTARFSFTQASTRLTCQDLLQIQGFSDGSVIQLNPVQITYVWDHRIRVATGQADCAQMMPDIGSIMQQGAAQVSLRATHDAAQTDLDVVYVVKGFDISFTGLTVNVAAGVVTYQGTQYSVPAWSYTLANDQVIEIGAQVSGTPPTGVTLPSTVIKPNVTGLTVMHALNVFSVTRPATQGAAITVNQDTNFIGVCLWRITAQGGVIAGSRDDRVFGGVGAINLQSANFAAPSLSAISVTKANSVVGITQDVTVSATFGNIPTDGTSNRIIWLIRTGGATAWTPWAETSIPGLPTPAASQALSFTYQGLSNGGAYDFGCAYVAVRGDNSGAVATISSAFATDAWGKRVPATAPTFTVTPANVVYTATGPNNYGVTVPFSATNQSSITNATGVSVWYTAHGQTTPITSLGTLALNSSGSYSVTLPSLPDGTQTYDVWAAFTDVSGNPGTSQMFFTTTAFTAPAAGSGGTMPSGTNASATFVSNTFLNSWSNPYLAGVNFTIPTAQTTAPWLQDVKLVYQPLNFSFLTAAAAAAATTITVNWPFPAGVAVGDALTFTQGSTTETKTVSAIGTPTSTTFGTQTNTITLTAGLTNSYSAYACQVTGKLGTNWLDAGKLPVNSGGSYYGIWACPPYSALAIQLIDYAGNGSGISPVLFQVGSYRHSQGGTAQSGAVGLTPNVVSTGAISYNNVGNGAYDAIEAVTFDGLGTSQNPWLQTVEYLISTNNSSTTLSAAAAKGATSVTVTSASNINANDQITFDTGANKEYSNVLSVSGTTVTLQAPLQIAHASGASVTTNTWKHYGYEPVNTSGAYSLDWVSMGAGNVYQLGVRYVDTAGGVSFVVNVGQTAANPIAVQPTQLPSVPSGFAFTGASASPTYSGNAGAYTCAFTASINITNYGTGSPALNSWLDHVDVLTAPSGSGNWTVNTVIPVGGFTPSGTSVSLSGLGAGQAYDVMYRLVAVNNGSYVSTGTIFTTTAQTIGNTALNTMPSAIKTNGPTISSMTANARTNRAGMLQSATVTFTETDFTSTPAWIDKILIRVRNNGDTSDGPIAVPVDPRLSTTGTYSNILVQVMRGDSVDIGIAYTSLAGEVSATKWSVTASQDSDGDVWDSNDRRKLAHFRSSIFTQNLITPNGSTNNSNPNLLPGSDFAVVGATPAAPMTGNVPKFWAPYNNANVNYAYAQDTAAAPPFGTAWKITNNSGAATTNTMGLYAGTGNLDGSANQTLYAGMQYVFSYYAKASVANIIFSAFNNTGVTMSVLSGFPQSYNDTAWHRYAFLITVGTANYTGGVFASIGLGQAIPNAGSIWIAAPQLEEGSICSVWSGPSPAGGTAIDFGLPHSNKNVDNIGDGTTFGRPLVSRLSGGKPWIDFSETIHTNKNVDWIGDGTTYGRPLATYLRSGRPYSFLGSWSSTTAYNPGDEVTYGNNYYLCVTANTNSAPNYGSNANWQLHGPVSLDAVVQGVNSKFVAGTEMSGNFVKQLNDGTNIRTIANVVSIVDANGNMPSSTSMNSNTPSVPPFSTDAFLHIYAPSGATYLQCYIDTNGLVGADNYIHMSNGATIGPWPNLSSTTFTSVAANGAFASATTSSNGIQFNGLNSNSKYYVMASYKPGTGLWTIAISAQGGFTASQVMQVNQDGYSILTGNNVQSTPVGGGGTGGGGHALK